MLYCTTGIKACGGEMLRAAHILLHKPTNVQGFDWETRCHFTGVVVALRTKAISIKRPEVALVKVCAQQRPLQIEWRSSLRGL